MEVRPYEYTIRSDHTRMVGQYEYSDRTRTVVSNLTYLMYILYQYFHDDSNPSDGLFKTMYIMHQMSSKPILTVA